MAENQTGAILGGFIIGAVVGAGVALLLAPQSGEETRGMLMDKSRSLKEGAKSKLDDLKEGAKSKMEDLKDGAKSKLDDVKQTLKDGARDVSAALSEGRDAYRRSHESSTSQGS